jgi:hypothetical protein
MSYSSEPQVVRVADADRHGLSNNSTERRLGSDRAEGHNTCANRPHIRSDCAWETRRKVAAIESRR